MRYIYYKRSTDEGISWGSDTRLTNNSSVSEWPTIFVSGLDVHVTWYDNRDGNYELYYKRSFDGGESWESDTRLTNAAGNSFNPSISVAGQVVHVIWYDKRDGNNEVYYKRSIDGGGSWGADTRLTNNSAESWDPAIAASDNLVHVVWWDERDGNYEIYYKRSIDTGLSWSSDIRLTNDNSLSGFVNMSVLDSLVFVVWVDNRNGNNEIYYKISLNNGVSWETDHRLTNDPGSSERPSSFISGLYFHVTWQENRDGNEEIYYKYSTNGGIIWGEDTRLTNNSDVSEHPFISVTGSVVSIIWSDSRDGNSEIYYRRNPTGNPTEVRNYAWDIQKDYSLSQNFPNPFNPSTTISWQSPVGGHQTIKVYDVLGNEVATLVDEYKSAGRYEVEFNALTLPSKVYFYQLRASGETGEFIQTKKMMILK